MVIDMRRAKQTLHKHMKHAGYARWFRAFVALIFLVSTAIPAFMWLDGMKAYAISPEVEKVIGSANKNLSAKFSFDEQGSKWQFNKNGAMALAANIAKQQKDNDPEGLAGALSQLTAKQVGGSGKNDTSLYSVDLSVKAKRGITYYDNVNKLSFTMVPDFASRDAKLVQDRIVYPFGDDGQIVYTAKTNGLKEDIVLKKYIGDTLRYSYNLQLPEYLEARLLDDGSIGIYSASVSLFGNISFSGDEDKARVMDARKNGTKDNLVFTIPAPFIKDQQGKAGHTKYLLNDNRITVVAEGLRDLTYPLTVDPSVTVTTSNDFSLGNNEGGSSIDTADQLTRGSTTGGVLGSWTTQTGMSGMVGCVDGNLNRSFGTYNGYIYNIYANRICYAKLNTNGTISGSWQSGAAYSTRNNNAAFIYNGYIYLTGSSTGTDSTALTMYAKISDVDGSVGTFVNGPDMVQKRRNHAAVAYNGYAYALGGAYSLVSVTNSVEKAAINADGSLGTWTTTGVTAMSEAKQQHSAVAYNGYLYAIGGNGTYNVIFAPIADNGDIGSWSNTTSVPNDGGPMRATAVVVHNGYMYMVSGANAGGSASTTVRFAPVYANGSLGNWLTTTPLPVGATDRKVAIHNGYMFVAGRYDESVYSAPISSAGATGSYSAPGSYDSGGRTAFASATYNNVVYIVGGNPSLYGGSGVATTRYAPVNADGSMGTWQTASSNFNNTATSGHGCASGCSGRTGLAAAAYKGYLYISGGNGTGGNAGDWSDLQSAVICTGVNAPVTGCVGAGDLRNWKTVFADYTTNNTTTYNSANGRGRCAMVIHNDVMYIIGGADAANVGRNNQIYQSNLTANGGAGNFILSSVVLPSAKSNIKSFVASNRLYIVGGANASGWNSKAFDETSDVRFVPIRPDGTLDSTVGWKDANATINGGSGSSFVSSGLNAYTTAVHNNKLYVAGGTNASSIAQTIVYSATINADGSLGAWSTLTPYSGARFGNATLAINGYLYIIGGCSAPNILGTVDCNSTAQILSDYQYAPIHNGGNGAIDTSWNNSSAALANGRYGTGVFTYNGYMHVLGGRIGGGLLGNSVSAPISSSGVVGPWTTLASLPTMYSEEAWTLHNGYIYKIGGRGTSTTAFKEVYYAAICTGSNVTTVFGTNCAVGSSPGTTSSWNATSSMNTGRGSFGSVAHNGYLYALGGCTASSRPDYVCTSFSNTVEVAQINSVTGAVGGWTTLSAGNNFQMPRDKHQTVAYNGYVYILGGCTSHMVYPSGSDCTGDLNDVQMASLGSGGLAADAGCGAVWCKQNVFISPRMEFGADAYNGYLYITGGGEGPFNDVQYVSIGANGFLGRWESAFTNFATARRGHSTVAYAGNLYVISGANNGGTAFYSDIQFSRLQTIARAGRYSKLLRLNPTTQVSGVHYNGVLGQGSSVTYKVAPSSGIFGPTSVGAQGSGSEPTPLCGIGAIYYVQLMATLDDSTRATFPDVNTSNITDFTVYYRLNATPPPNLRLTGGKWFWNENQRPLDTCKRPNV